MRASTFEYEPIWEATSDWHRDDLSQDAITVFTDKKNEEEYLAEKAKYKSLSEIDLGNFTLFCIDVCWEAGCFTFHIALLGFHIGRSLQIKLT